MSLWRSIIPELFEEMKEYIKQGRWHVTGSAFENGDTNCPSPEALFRNILIGNSYFDEKFGKRSLVFICLTASVSAGLYRVLHTTLILRDLPLRSLPGAVHTAFLLISVSGMALTEIIFMQAAILTITIIH